MFTRYRKTILILAAILLLIPAYFYVEDCYYKYQKYEEYESPDGQYTLTVYLADRRDLLTHCFMGDYRDDFRYRNAYATLSNKSGKVLYKPCLFDRSRFMLSGMDLEWNEKNVCVSKAQYYIDYK